MTDTAIKAGALQLTTVAALSQEWTDKADRARELTERIKADTKELKPLDEAFKTLHAETGQRVFFAADGKTVAVSVDHGERMILDQPRLTLERPEIVAAYQRLSEWESPHYGKG